MRRTLTVLVTSAALLVPATAASASDVRVTQNASCSSGQQRGPDGSTYNNQGNTARALSPSACGGTVGDGGSPPAS